jgi:hypothetical protein
MVATASTDPSHLKKKLNQMETKMKRLVLGVQKFPLYLRNTQLKYKLSDWELARTKLSRPRYTCLSKDISSQMHNVQ